MRSEVEKILKIEMSKKSKIDKILSIFDFKLAISPQLEAFRTSKWSHLIDLVEISSMRPSVGRYNPGNIPNSKSMTPKKRDFFS